jgi:hypothetical protein
VTDFHDLGNFGGGVVSLFMLQAYFLRDKKRLDVVNRVRSKIASYIY